MRDLKIAYGNSCHSKKWSNKVIRFGDLKERLKTTIRTTESVEEYAKFTRAKKTEAKDKGGFVGGSLIGGRRTIDSVSFRSMISLDADSLPKNWIEENKDVIPYMFVAYSTHGHTVDKPRYRIIFPLTRDVNPEEFVAVSRYLGSELGIDYFDECSYLPNQLMFWPSTPSNGDFSFIENDKEWLNPDDILKAHPEWQDPTQLPTSSRESVAKGINYKKVADPLLKVGVVGLFNRAYYPINHAIDLFLSEVYAPTSSDNRYHFRASSSMAGAELKDDGKFMYSHHAKDPVYLKLCNAFDLVRIHLFGEDDKSYKNMCEFAMKQDEVKQLIAKERMEEANEEFTDDDWNKRLQYSSRSKELLNNVWNLLLILENDRDFENFAFNEFVGRIEITGEVPWERPSNNRFWRDADTAQLKALIDIRYGVFSARNFDVAFTKVVEDRHFHPIREWIRTLPHWDGVKRLDTLFIDYLGAENSEYVKAVTRKTFVAAVARVLNPGVKFDYITVLVGPQGCGKSTAFAKMGGLYYSDSLSLTDMKDKSGAEKLQGYWILELGELAGLKKTDVEVVKAFVSRVDDIYRPSYGRVVESHPRQSIIVGTTNAESGFLRDITGNRRFWPIKVNSSSLKKTWDILTEDVIQMWAEAKKLYEDGEELFLSKEQNNDAIREQILAMESDERQGAVEVYLSTRLPNNWDELEIYERRNFLHDELSPEGDMERKYVSNIEIWCECFGRNLADLKPSDSYAIAALMNKVDGWRRTNFSKRLPIYGKQRVYEKI